MFPELDDYITKTALQIEKLERSVGNSLWTEPQKQELTRLQRALHNAITVRPGDKVRLMSTFTNEHPTAEVMSKHGQYVVVQCDNRLYGWYYVAIEIVPAETLPQPKFKVGDAVVTEDGIIGQVVRIDDDRDNPNAPLKYQGSIWYVLDFTWGASYREQGLTAANKEQTALLDQILAVQSDIDCNQLRQKDLMAEMEKARTWLASLNASYTALSLENKELKQQAAQLAKRRFGHSD